MSFAFARAQAPAWARDSWKLRLSTPTEYHRIGFGWFPSAAREPSQEALAFKHPRSLAALAGASGVILVFLVGSWSFRDRVPKQELGNERKHPLSALARSANMFLAYPLPETRLLFIPFSSDTSAMPPPPSPPHPFPAPIPGSHRGRL